MDTKIALILTAFRLAAILEVKLTLFSLFLSLLLGRILMSLHYQKLPVGSDDKYRTNPVIDATRYFARACRSFDRLELLD